MLLSHKHSWWIYKTHQESLSNLSLVVSTLDLGNDGEFVCWKKKIQTSYHIQNIKHKGIKWCGEWIFTDSGWMPRKVWPVPSVNKSKEQEKNEPCMQKCQIRPLLKPFCCFNFFHIFILKQVVIKEVIMIFVLYTLLLDGQRHLYSKVYMMKSGLVPLPKNPNMQGKPKFFAASSYEIVQWDLVQAITKSVESQHIASMMVSREHPVGTSHLKRFKFVFPGSVSRSIFYLFEP